MDSGTQPGPKRTARWVVWALVCLCLGLVPREARAQNERYALVVEGTTGGEPYATTNRQWLDRLVKLLRDRCGFDAAHLTVLAEQPGAGEQPATAESVRGVLGRMAGQVKDTDLVFVMLIGHGGGEGADVKFNLVGPDLTVAEWAGLLKPVAARLAFVDTTGSSFAFLAGLSAPGRVVITATNANAQHFDTVFADAFIQGLSADIADADKNTRISLLEAFAYATRMVALYYQQRGQLATEHAVFNDTGDGKPHDTALPGEAAGTIAGLTYLDPLVTPRSSNPAVQPLLVRQQALTQQVDELRRQRPSMLPQAYDEAFEKLIVELALVSRDVRRLTGG
jgi:hypothetical protein